jgi:hypothetical protein
LNVTDGSIVHQSTLPTFDATSTAVTTYSLYSVLLASSGIVYMATSDMVAAIYLNGTAVWSHMWEDPGFVGVASMAIFPNGTLIVAQAGGGWSIFGGGGGCQDGYAPSMDTVVPTTFTCDICPPGTYSSQAAYCRRCPAGTFSDAVGAPASTSCLPCLEGLYSHPGATSCFTCPGITYSEPGSGHCSRVYIGVQGTYLLALSIAMAAVILLSFAASRAPWIVLGFVFFPALDVIR